MKIQFRWVLAACLAGSLAGGCHFCRGREGVAKLQTNWLDMAVGVDKAPVFGWQMRSSKRGAAQRAYRIVLARDKEMKSVVWDSGRVPSSFSVGIPYTGAALSAATRYWWAVEVEDQDGKTFPSVPVWFETGLMNSENWKGSQWIMAAPLAGGKTNSHPAMALRKIMKNGKDIASAKWFVSGLGVFEAYVNGVRISNLDDAGRPVYDELKPGFTDARKTRHYFSYDVTHLLRCGAGEENVFAAVVTRGWWSDQINGKTGKKDAFRGQLLVRYADGSEARFGTDTTWDAAFAGPVVSAEIHAGEVYDARLDSSWMTGSAVGAGWGKAVVNDEFKGKILPLQGPAARVRKDLQLRPARIDILKGVSEATDKQHGIATVVRSYQDGQKISLDAGETLVVDFGQNAAGWESLQMVGGEGAKLLIRHAEILNDNKGIKSRGNDGPEGMPYFANLRKAFASTRYTFSGKGIETYSPAFSFYGYRYIAITSSAHVEFLKIRSEIVTSVLEGTDTGTLSTSDSSINQLIKNCEWGHYSNYLSVPTDCPQRDERLGWAADTQVFSPAAAYHAQTYGFLSKFMSDMRDSQHDDGGFPAVAPYAQYGNNGNCVGWADAGILVPYNMWKAYGDTTILKENFAAMCKYMDLVEKGNGPVPLFGDWLAYERNDKDLQMYICAAYYVWDARMMTEMAAALQDKAAVKRFTAMAEKAKDFFTKNYLNTDGTIQKKYMCQTACLFALFLDLNKDAASTAATKAALLKNIADHGDKLQTGFLGTAIIMGTLTKIGETGIAYKLLLQRGNPSWLYSVDQGATTMWERWNSYTKEKGFGDVGMNSFNHYAYGAVLDWMFNTMAGIRYHAAQPGYRHFILHPQPNASIKKVTGTYLSPYGRIVSAWQYIDNAWSYYAEIPANSEATVLIPCPAGERVTVNGKPPAALTLKDDSLVYLGMQDGCAAFKAVAGTFSVFVK